MNNSDWIAIASGTIALCALGTSYWQAHATSKHNKLSARPLLHININVKPGEVAATLTNVGLGPAFLDGLLFRQGNNTYDFFGDSFNDFLDLFKNPGAAHTDFYAHRVPRGTVVPVGQEFLLFKVLEPSSDPEHLMRLNGLLPQIQYNKVYRSIYGQEFNGQ